MGRTGTLITIDRVLDQIKKEGVVDIAGIVHHLRSQRMKLVQNPVGWWVVVFMYVQVLCVRCIISGLGTLAAQKIAVFVFVISDV